MPDYFEQKRNLIEVDHQVEEHLLDDCLESSKRLSSEKRNLLLNFVNLKLQGFQAPTNEATLDMLARDASEDDSRDQIAQSGADVYSTLIQISRLCITSKSMNDNKKAIEDLSRIKTILENDEEETEPQLDFKILSTLRVLVQAWCDEIYEVGGDYHPEMLIELLDLLQIVVGANKEIVIRNNKVKVLDRIDTILQDDIRPYVYALLVDKSQGGDINPSPSSFAGRSIELLKTLRNANVNNLIRTNILQIHKSILANLDIVILLADQLS